MLKLSTLAPQPIKPGNCNPQNPPSKSEEIAEIGSENPPEGFGGKSGKIRSGGKVRGIY